jgi:class 3 adenylate cyclase
VRFEGIASGACTFPIREEVEHPSRIAAMCRSAERGVLLSSALAAAACEEDRAAFVSVGRYAFRGAGGAQELFTLEWEVGGLNRSG